MPGFKQSDIIAQIWLFKHLRQAGYEASQKAPSRWRHKSLLISFTLVVDDFGVKYVCKDASMHLISALQKDILFLLIVLAAIISGSP